jgi:hypothetical protein
LELENPDVKIAVLLPELVVRHWWEYFLHNQRVQLLKVMLLLKGKQRIIVVNIPWYLGVSTERVPPGTGNAEQGGLKGIEDAGYNDGFAGDELKAEPSDAGVAVPQ